MIRVFLCLALAAFPVQWLDAEDGLSGSVKSWVLHREEGLEEFVAHGQAEIHCVQLHRGIRLFSEGVLDCMLPWDGLADLQMESQGQLKGAIFLSAQKMAEYAFVVPMSSPVRRGIHQALFFFGGQKDELHGAAFGLRGLPSDRIEFTFLKAFRSSGEGCDAIYLAPAKDSTRSALSYYFELCQFSKARYLGWEEINTENEAEPLIQGAQLLKGYRYWYHGTPVDNGNVEALMASQAKIDALPASEKEKVVLLKNF